MRKIITLALCSVALIGVNAQKANVDQAKKLAGKPEKIQEARNLINQAISNPETANSVDTYYVAGKIEWDSYDKNSQKLKEAPESIDAIEVSNELINGYNFYQKVFELDQLPNEKGEVKPKYIKELQKKIADYAPEFWAVGATYYGNQMYYPQAYDAFMTYGDMPDNALLGKEKPAIPDTLRATAYFYAGISGWSANKVDEAAKAFEKARLHNANDPQVYIYELACWQNIEQNDESRAAEARDKIYDAAKAGYEKYGMEQPVFLTNMINSLINSQREAEAVELVNGAMSQYPDRASLYGLRAFVYDRMGNEEASEADYRAAAEMPDVDYDTMRHAVNKLLRAGQEKWNQIELGDPEIREKKAKVKSDYFEVAKRFAEKAKTLTDDPADMDYYIESIDYQLSL